MSRRSNHAQTAAIACTLSPLLLSTAWAAVVSVHINVPVIHPKVPVVIVKPNVAHITTTTGNTIGSRSSGAGAGNVRFNDLHVTAKVASPGPLKGTASEITRSTHALNCKLCGVTGARGGHETVNGNQSVTIGSGRGETVGNGKGVIIGGNQVETVGSGKGVIIGGNQVETVSSSKGVIIGGNQVETVGSGKGVIIGGNQVETVGGTLNPPGLGGDIDRPVVIGSVWNGPSGMVGGTGIPGGNAPSATFSPLGLGNVVRTGPWGTSVANYPLNLPATDPYANGNSYFADYSPADIPASLMRSGASIVPGGAFNAAGAFPIGGNGDVSGFGFYTPMFDSPANVVSAGPAFSYHNGVAVNSIPLGYTTTVNRNIITPWAWATAPSAP
jgi:hypothetical protein